MQAVITVVGTDRVGILARVATVCAEAGVNIEEVTQSILSGTFAMIMKVDISRSPMEFSTLVERLQAAGQELGVDVSMTRQELYDAMHRI